ncbi:PspC domain-containing protein [Pedobacter sp. GR22-6]|uniref:PspC domain-containing protein n=1 Tax=Pedobacter sp. GR22-6 TaxID=3127957 RepID=UPI00307DE99E
MKKTLNINIGNTIVHIEEDAYEMLTIYLNEVKQHFARSADDFEIVKDIENRIAEMFAEKLAAAQKQAISMEDVQGVMQQMGSVKDFENSEEENETPEQPFVPFSGVKKLYRDTDHGVIAGVCLGLSHYLNIDVIWIRLFALMSVFLAGGGIVAYIVLWIMVPRAQSRSEKMQMRGQETNLRGFAYSQMQPLVNQSKGFIAEAVQLLGSFLSGTGRVIFKICAGLIIAFCSFFLLILIGGLAAMLGFWDSDLAHYFPVNIVNEEYLTALTFASFIIGSIPLLALILFSIRVAFNGAAINKTLSFGLLIVWLAGVVTGVFYVAKISTEFKAGAEFAQVTDLKPYKEYTVQLDRARFFTKEDSLRYRIDAKGNRGRKILQDLDDDFNMPSNHWFYIEKSEDGRTTLNQSFKARGKTFEVALKHAQDIQYGFLQEGAVLNFSSAMWFPREANWRGQEVELTLRVPVGTELKIEKGIGRYFNGFRHWGCDEDSKDNFTEWVMTVDGLKCKHEPKPEENEE